MSVFDRIRSAFVRSPSSADVVERAASVDPFGAIGSAVVGLGTETSRRGRDDILTSYSENPTLRLTTHAAASAVARVPWRVYRPRDEDVVRQGFLSSYAKTTPIARTALRRRAVQEGTLIELPYHPLQTLIDKPNASMSGFAFRMLAEVHYRLLGEWAAIVERDEATGQPASMWLIPTTWIREFPTRAEPSFLVDMRTTSATSFVGRVPVDSMIYVRDHDPSNPYGRGIGNGIALANEIDVDEHAARMISSFFQNGGMPAFIVSMEGAGTAALQRAKARWSSSFRGFQRAYQTFFTGAKLSAQRLDTSFKDMNLVEIRKAQRDLMISSSGMPPEKVGVLASSNRATIEAADVIEAKNVIIPALEVFRLELQAKLVPLYDSRLVIDYDDPTPADVDRENAIMQSSSHVFTIDEIRALAGRGPLPDGKGDAFLVDPGKVYVRSLDELSSGTPIFGYHLNAGVVTNNEVREKLGLAPTSEEWGDERAVGFYSPLMESDDFDFDIEDVSAAPVDGDEPATMASLLASEKSALRRRRRAMRAGVSRSLMRRILSTLRAADLARATTTEIRALMDAWGQETISSIDNSAKFDSSTESMQDYVDDYASERVAMINETTRKQVEAVLREWDGDDVEVVLSSLSDVFTSARVERSQIIASVESVRASQFAAVEAYKQSGIVAEKEWIAVADGRTREAHLALDGQVVALDDPFSVPSGEWAGAQAMQPGGFGIAALDINCRCQSAPIFDEDTKGRTPEARAALWIERDAKLRKLEARVRDAWEEAFEKQQEKTLDVARALLDD